MSQSPQLLTRDSSSRVSALHDSAMTRAQRVEVVVDEGSAQKRAHDSQLDRRLSASV